MNGELGKKTLRIRQLIDSQGYRYHYSEMAADTYKKMFEYLDSDQRLMRFSADYVGTISDCLILYAVAQLGVADRKAVQLFLMNLKKLAPELLISDAENESAVISRIAELKKSGFLFVHNYIYMTPAGKKMENSLYTITKEGISIMNMKLEKRIPYNNWMQAKRLPELMGWASCASVAVRTSHAANFYQYLDGVFRSKYLGTFYFPCEMKFSVNDIPAYVAFLHGYLIFDSNAQTEDDFNAIRALKVNAIKNYISTRTSKGPAYVVVVVQDNRDLVMMAETILLSGVLEECLSNVYFTGAGVFKDGTLALQDSFLKMILREGGATPFDFVAATPEFLL